MSDYCSCDKPELTKVTIAHEDLEVCSKRQGGCGKEYKPNQVNPIDADDKDTDWFLSEPSVPDYVDWIGMPDQMIKQQWAEYERQVRDSKETK